MSSVEGETQPLSAESAETETLAKKSEEVGSTQIEERVNPEEEKPKLEDEEAPKVEEMKQFQDSVASYFNRLFEEEREKRKEEREEYERKQRLPILLKVNKKNTHSVVYSHYMFMALSRLCCQSGLVEENLRSFSHIAV